MGPWRLGTVLEFAGTKAARKNSGSGHEKTADAGLSLLLWGRITACDPHALGGDQCGEQRGPDLKHSTTRNKSADTPAERITKLGRASVPIPVLWPGPTKLVIGSEDKA